MKNVTVVDHPLIQHKLSIMRDKNTNSSKFRQLLREISLLLAYEVTRDFPLSQVEIETPLAPYKAPKLDGKKVVIVSILRGRQWHFRRNARLASFRTCRTHWFVSRPQNVGCG